MDVGIQRLKKKALEEEADHYFRGLFEWVYNQLQTGSKKVIDFQCKYPEEFEKYCEDRGVAAYYVCKNDMTASLSWADLYAHEIRR